MEIGGESGRWKAVTFTRPIGTFQKRKISLLPSLVCLYYGESASGESERLNDENNLNARFG